MWRATNILGSLSLLICPGVSRSSQSITHLQFGLSKPHTSSNPYNCQDRARSLWWVLGLVCSIKKHHTYSKENEHFLSLIPRPSVNVEGGSGDETNIFPNQSWISITLFCDQHIEINLKFFQVTVTLKDCSLQIKASIQSVCSNDTLTKIMIILCMQTEHTIIFHSGIIIVSKSAI